MGKGTSRDAGGSRTREAELFGGLVLVLGLVGVGRAWARARPPVSPWDVGRPVSLRPEDLSGDAWRLLPGVGPVLAERLEAARREAGGVLSARDLEHVEGVGPATLARWRALWGLAGDDDVR